METDQIAKGESLKVLVLEDSARDFEIISEQLIDAGFKLNITRVEKEDAFRYSLRENQYDIILSDFKLPGFDAFGALRISNHICPEIPFICVSGSIGEETAIELLKLGALDYVLKDRPERLPFAVKRALDEVKERKIRKKAQEELLFNYALFRIAGSTAKLGGWSIDLSTNIVAWSDVVADIHEIPRGYAPEVTEGIRFYAPEWQDKIKRVFTDCAEKGISYDEEMEIITRTGRRIWVRITGEAVKNEAGEVIKVQGSFQDITERKQSLHALQEANRKLQASQKAALSLLEDLNAENRSRKAKEAELQKVTMAIEQAGEVIMITDPAGMIQYVNPAFETVSGYTREEAVGKTSAILKSGKQDPAFYQNLWKTIASGRIWQGSMVNKRKDGTLYTEDATISPVCDATGKIINYVGVKRDITAHLELTAQLQQAQKMESVGRLAGGVAHDYNNMLSIILGYTELAMAKIDATNPMHADLQEVFNAAMRSTDITRQLLAFARKQTVAPVVLDLNTTVEDMLKMLRRLIGEDISLAWLPAAGLWPVKIDPSQVDQILANLCVNARDAIKGVGKVTIETANVIFDDAYCAMHRGFAPGAFVLLAVGDNGCGMDKETLDHIFEPFFTTKEIGKGTGLGLATVYGIVKQNDGFINVYSEPGHGTVFKVYLPRAREALAEPFAPEQHKPAQGVETLLLVEDERAILEVGKAILEQYGYTVLAAPTPGEALDLTRQHDGPIHMLITDVVMPEMNGKDLKERIAALRPGIKTLYMSGYTANVIAHRGVIDEGINFLQKPFSIHTLAAKVREVLDQP